MPLDTRTVDIEREVETLEQDREELADKVANHDDPPQQLIERGQRLDRYIAGLQWYQDTLGGESVTLGALTNGERHQVRDTAERIGASTAGRQNAYVAMGTVEGEYVEHDANDILQDEFEDTIANVTDLHPAFVDWAEQEITELGRMDGDTGKSFSELVLAKQTQANSPETNG